MPRDMPNIFVEALTIADGKVHDEAREIAIPPESRVVDIAVEPSADRPTSPARRPRSKLTLHRVEAGSTAASSALRRLDRAGRL